MPTNFDRNDMISYRGDDLAFDTAFNDTDGNPIDVTGWVLYFTVKAKRDDPDFVGVSGYSGYSGYSGVPAVIAKEYMNLVTPAGGIITVIVSHTDTDPLIGPYFYDLQVKKGDNTIQTIANGTITFTKDITRRNT